MKLFFLISSFLFLHCPLSTATYYKYGKSPEGLREEAGGDHWSYEYAGADWVGKDSKGDSWSCLTGSKQSPINIVSSNSPRVSPGHQTKIDLGTLTSNGSNVEVINNGHTVQVEWVDSKFTPLVSIVLPDVTQLPSSGESPLVTTLDLTSRNKKTRTVELKPFQFHFHVHSEHALGGRFFPAEAHLVSRVQLEGCPEKGCFSVVAILYELSEDLNSDNEFLKKFTDVMPSREGEVGKVPAGELRMDQLLPTDKAYVAYQGSLTTPPCTENILWHVLLSPVKISIGQLQKLMSSVADYDCDEVLSVESSNNSVAPLLSGGRRHHARRSLLSESTAPTNGSSPQYNCKTLGVGNNYRLPQPLNNRTLKMWSEEGTISLRDYLQEKKEPLAEGAIAGIVIGTLGGAGLTVLVGYLVYKQYQKRRVQRMFLVSQENQRIMERDYEPHFTSAI